MMNDKLRVASSDIDEAIIEGEIQYHRFPGTTTIVCCISLHSGINVIGESAAVSKEKFNEEVGRLVAFKHAKDRLWSLLGCLLLDRVARQSGVIHAESA